MKKILVLEGGFNEEHEISLNTSKEVQKSLKRMKFKFEVLQVNPVNFSEKIEFYDDNVLCFNALHGTYGEDGTIQKILENKKITYTHSDSKVSNIAVNGPPQNRLQSISRRLKIRMTVKSTQIVSQTTFHSIASTKLTIASLENVVFSHALEIPVTNLSLLNNSLLPFNKKS